MISLAICDNCGWGSFAIAVSVSHSFMYTEPNPVKTKSILFIAQELLQISNLNYLINMATKIFYNWY